MQGRQRRSVKKFLIPWAGELVPNIGSDLTAFDLGYMFTNRQI